jgi:hypothetical protein
VATFVSLGIAEVALRVWWTNPFANVTPSSVVEVRLNAPNLNQVFDRTWFDRQDPKVQFRTDSRGFILPSKQHDKPLFTIAFVGGSTTECSYVSENLRFPAYVSRVFADHGQRVNTINAGRSGNTTHDAINIILNSLAADMPDFVVLMEAINDAGVLAQDPVYRSRMAAPVGADSQLRWLAQALSSWSSFAGLMRDIFTRMQNARSEKAANQNGTNNSAVALPEASEARFVARLHIFAAMVRALGGRPVLMTQPFAHFRTSTTPEWMNAEQQNRFNTLIREAAKGDGVLLVDLAQLLAAVPDFVARPANYLYDGLHATDLASRRYGEWIFEALRADSASTIKYDR